MNETNRILNFLQENYHQSVPNKRYWTSYKYIDRDNEYWHLTKEFSNRTACQFEIIFGSLTDSTPNLQIHLFTVVDNAWMQVFWGDIETLEDLKFILNKIGIPYKNIL